MMGRELMGTDRRGNGPRAVVFLCVLALGCSAVWAGESSPGLDEIISGMQSRADQVGSLSGVLGRQVTVPVEGEWQGEPFRFRAPDSFIQLTGWTVDSPGESAVKEENAWHIVRDGVEYRRRGGRTRRVQPGTSWEDLAYSNGAETLLVANLMPRQWFGALEGRLRVGPVEEVGDSSYYTLIETKKNRGEREIQVRYHEFRLRRMGRARKYYINADTFVCERIVLGYREGPLEKPTGLDDPEGDIRASQIETVGEGGLLPLAYERRSFGDGGVYEAVKVTLEQLEARSADSFPDAEFSPQARTPGDRPIVLRPMADFEKLRQKVKTDPTPSEVLTLASMYARMKFSHGRKGMDVLKRGDELFEGQKPQGYQALRDELALELERDIVRRRKEEAPQMERIFRRRAERFRQQGDQDRADEMSQRADTWQQRAEEARQRWEEIR